MSREEILAKIKGFEDKLEMDSFKDYHENFRQGIDKLKGELKALGGEEPKEEKPKEEKPKEEKPKAEKKTPPKKKATKKKATKKQPTKDEYESAMADLKKKSGMTEEKCLEIIEEYRALRKKSQERKAKENKAKTKKNAEQKKRTDKLKEQGKLNEEGTLTPEAVIEQDIPKVEEKAEKEIEQIVEENTPKPTKEEPKPKPTKQGEKKIKEGVKEVAEDTTDAIQEMLMAILGVVKNQEPTIAKASLIKLRDALTKEINSMAYGGLTDGAVANLNVTQSQMSAESVNPQMYAKGGGIPTKFYWIEMDRDKIDEYIDFASRMRGIFENEIYTQGVNRVAFVTDDDRFSFTSMIENHNNDNDLNEGDEGYIYYKELYGDKAMPNIFDKISRDNYAKGGEVITDYEYFRGKDHDEFTNYIFDRISLDDRREIRKEWNEKERVSRAKGERGVEWQQYLLDSVNKNKMAKGGRMEQGYNDRLDESLGMRHRGHHSQSHKDRRDEAKGMNKGMGNRAYQSVGSMDKMAKGGSTNANWIQDVVDSPNFEKGAFTRKAKNRGMTTMELMKDVLSNPNEYTLKTRRQAQFMKNAM